MGCGDHGSQHYQITFVRICVSYEGMPTSLAIDNDPEAKFMSRCFAGWQGLEPM